MNVWRPSVEYRKKYGFGYEAVHHWITYHFGRAVGCERCGADDVWLIYDWSNIGGNYLRDISDWERLCRGCHVRKDLSGTCHRGHDLTEGNVYNHPTGGRMCRICRARARRASASKWAE